MSGSTVTGSVNRFHFFRFRGLVLLLLGLALLCVEPSSNARAAVAGANWSETGSWSMLALVKARRYYKKRLELSAPFPMPIGTSLMAFGIRSK